MNNHLASLLLLGSLAFANVSAVHGKEVPTKETVAKAAPIHLTLSNKAGGGGSVTGFDTAQPEIFLDFQGEMLTKGDKIKAVWFIEDGGKGIKPNAKVSDFTIVADGPRGRGSFHLTKPVAGWPLGKWRVDVYINDTKVESVKFTIK